MRIPLPSRAARPAAIAVVAMLLLLPAVSAAAPTKPGAFDARIRRITSEVAPDLITIRRDLHAHPELSFQEKRTAGIVAEEFRRLGFDVRTGLGATGVVGVLKGGKPGPIVAMRGDMDCLGVTEATDLPFASKDTAVVDGREIGLMHACGHDVHTTLLLGVARVLAKLRAEIPGTVVFIAQPAEEAGDGANAMIRDGAFKDGTPKAFFAYHVEDGAPVGTIKYTLGWSGANCDGFALTVKSPGGHGAYPHNAVDPVVVGAQIVTGLQVLVAREMNVQHDTVITVGSFHAGTASNIIPKAAELRATIRSYGDDQRELIKSKVTRFIENTCRAAGADFTLDYYYATPALYDDPALTKEVLPTAERILGGKKFLVEDQAGMGGEDFSYFAKLAPAVMLNLGVVPQGMEKDFVHSPTFVADEAAIPVGVTVMSAIIMDWLGAH